MKHAITETVFHNASVIRNFPHWSSVRGLDNQMRIKLKLGYQGAQRLVIYSHLQPTNHLL